MNDFKTTHSGTSLLMNHSLTEYGVWDIFGEDPNCDFGGYHSTPFLERVSGKLSDVIAYAEQLSNFWTWGSGGEIKPYKQKDVKVIPDGYAESFQRAAREEEKNKIKMEIEKLQNQLNSM